MTLIPREAQADLPGVGTFGANRKLLRNGWVGTWAARI